jgi:hypothetical protein
VDCSGDGAVECGKRKLLLCETSKPLTFGALQTQVVRSGDCCTNSLKNRRFQFIRNGKEARPGLLLIGCVGVPSEIRRKEIKHMTNCKEIKHMTNC